ncbi:hypothetical protein BV25DRAFT_916692 [Artomyces pyxidatus]|uniref:Uncharacterized protein n=1 Tax=Artomyces pyxidatus TaxID=48021 RepID=A0ACB8SVW2_9AGAM|nr:hypothetical protein BV25DRAFT_916692 [Artomyces pyxidatus]
MPPSGSSSPAGNSVLSKRGSDALRPEVYEEHDTLLPGQTPISRVPELWMSDGNIVLVCQGQAYRVHKGLLALNSVVFRDMVSNAQPDGDEVYAGCPVVRLSDAAEDIQHLLKAVYLRKYFRKGEAQSLSKIGSLLRITKKYMFDSIRQEVVKHFTLLFPSSMSDYISTTRQSLIPDDYNPFIAAQIAIEHDLSSTIPVAVYECTLLPMPTLFDGHSVGNAPTVYLTPSTQRMCITIRERIKQLVYEVADEFIWPWQTEEAEDPPHPYVDHPECIKAFEAARKSADCLYWADGYNVFMTRLSERLGNQESTVMCEICRLAWKDGEASGRVQLWRDLPGLCGLGDWLSLLKADGTVNRDAAIVATPVWSLEPIEMYVQSRGA